MTHRLLRFSLVLLAAAFFCSCSNDTQDIVGAGNQPFKKTTPTPAHPVLTQIGGVSDRQGYTHMTVAVYDSNGTHASNLFTASGVAPWAPGNAQKTALYFACWSPTGGSIAWVENGVLIKALDISVNSSGVPVASNVRTIYTSADTITGLSWCSVAGTARLAYTTSYYRNGSTSSDLRTVPQTGGASTLLTTWSDRVVESPTWSPDDSKIAVLLHAVTRPINAHIQVVSSTNGTLLEDDNLTNCLTNPTLIEWSRTGNTIAFGMTVAIHPTATYLYYIDYGSGLPPYTQQVPYGGCPTWSPNDASIIFSGSDSYGGMALQKVNAFGTLVNTLSKFPGDSPCQVEATILNVNS